MLVINRKSFGTLFLFLLALGIKPALAQDKKTVNLSIGYYLVNNNIPYVVATAKSKEDGKFKPVNDLEITFCLDTPGNVIAKVKTSGKGTALATIPTSMKDLWNKKTGHKFLATSAATKVFDESSADVSPAKARIVLDTTDDKNITAIVSEFKDNAWVPVKGVEVKLGIKRQGADLPIGDEASYTTDSLGQVKGEFKKLKLPGDMKGDLIIAARVDDNDQYGNLRVEKTIKWGSIFKQDSSFFVRALWGTRFRTPLWLLFMAYSIVITVWGTLIYLIFLLIKVKKLGKEELAAKK